LEEEEEFEGEPSCPEELIIQLMSKRFQYCSEESMAMNDILKKVGFDSQFAEDFANHIEADPLDMSRWDWIHHVVVSSLDHLWMKFLNVPTDGSKQGVTGSSCGDSTSQPKNYIQKHDIGKYLSGKDFPNNLLKIATGEDNNQNSDGVEFWYHGTSPTYADAITTYGIKLDKGKKKANYSNNDGFYLTDDLDLAMRSAFQKYCIPNFNNKRETVDEIAVIVFKLKTEDIKDYKRIDLRPTGKELKNKKLEPKKDERLRNIVYFFSQGAQIKKKRKMTEAENKEWQQNFENTNGLKHDYQEQIQFIVGPYTSFAGQGSEREKENIQIPDLELVQLCLRKPEIIEKFEEIMNDTWLSLRIPRGYSNIIAKNRKEKDTQDFIDYGIIFSRETLMKFNRANEGNNI
jgi:hypothetical protein